MANDDRDYIIPSMGRRTFVRGLTAGTVVMALGGGAWVYANDDKTRMAQKERLPDGRVRLPPGQSVIERLRPMGGEAGDPSPGAFRLRVFGEVAKPFEIDFMELLKMPQVEQTCDVHCVTKWTVLDSHWTGVRVSDLAERAVLKPSARHAIFMAAHGYTANVPLAEALRPTVLVAHKYEGAPLPRPNGPPVRALVPHLYFWKSAKWLTGIFFSPIDQPGYWETRGYHNHADPWKEERYG
jgi:DMSO/TMAO reductase YedYZ molybdopterin-dependent catalytic subunit